MEDEPPNLTIVIYKSFKTQYSKTQYFPIAISNNGQIDEKLKNFSNEKHIIGTYKVEPKYFDNVRDLCDSLFGKSKGIVKRRIEKLLSNGEKLVMSKV